MADYAHYAAMMDAQVDNRLGDSISYKRQTDPAPITVKAFLLFDEQEGGMTGMDPAKGLVRLKIAKSILKPSMNDRIQSPLLDGTYRPTANKPLTAGRYWLADLQKV